MAAVGVPSEIHIGTRKVFRQGCEYRYIFDERVSAYVCDNQTTTSVPGEVLVILQKNEPDGSVWYVALEGSLQVEPDGRARFEARQPVFRTQERFFESGDHEWQVNSESSSTNVASATWDGSMSAWTEIPQRALNLAFDARQLALTNA